MNTSQVPSAATVFIVDDDASFLRSLSRLLRSVGYAVEAFDSAQKFLQNLAPEKSGCVVADLQMPGMDGLQLQEALKKSPNPLPVVFLTGRGDIPATVNAMRGGADDFLTKRVSKEILLAAIARALERGAQERRERDRLRTLRRLLEELSGREREVLAHVVRGRMNKEIAAELGINLRTVKLHRTSITRKLDVKSAVELARLVDAAGLFSKTEKGG